MYIEKVIVNPHEIESVLNGVLEEYLDISLIQKPIDDNPPVINRGIIKVVNRNKKMLELVPDENINFDLEYQIPVISLALTEKIIFESNIINIEADLLQISFPKMIIFFNQSGKDTQLSEQDRTTQLQLISHLFSKIKSSDKYQLAKKKEIKDAKNLIFKPESKGLAEIKKDYIGISVVHKGSRQKISKDDYQLYELTNASTSEAQFISDETSVFKEGDEIQIHSLYGNRLNPTMMGEVVSIAPKGKFEIISFQFL